MLMAQHDVAATGQAADERQDADEARRQNLEQIFVQSGADLDGEAGLLPNFADERRTMILPGIGPAAGQIPFTAFVQKKKHAAVVDQHAFDGDGRGGHRPETSIVGARHVFRTASIPARSSS